MARQIAIETGQQERGERVLSSSSLLFFFFSSFEKYFGCVGGYIDWNWLTGGNMQETFAVQTIWVYFI